MPEDMGMSYEQQRRGFEALQRSAATLGEVLDRSLPHLPDANITRMTIQGGVTAISAKVHPHLELSLTFKRSQMKLRYVLKCEALLDPHVLLWQHVSCPQQMWPSMRTHVLR